MTLLAASVKAVIFDLGETLIAVPDEHDEDALISEYCGLTLQQIYLLTREICWNRKGLGEEEFAYSLTEAIGAQGKLCDIGVIKGFFDRSIENMVIQDDASRTLNALREAGKRIAIVSNSNPLSHRRIERAGLRHYANHVLLSCDTGFWKPDPRAYMTAFEQLGILDKHVLIVGDRIRTLALGAFQTGAQIVLLERRTPVTIASEQVPFAAVIPNLDELTRIVCQ